MSVCLRTCCKGCCDSSAGFPPSLQPMSPYSPCARTAAELGFVLCLGRTPWGERLCLRDSRIDLYCTDRSRIVKQSLDVIAMKPEIKIEVGRCAPRPNSTQRQTPRFRFNGALLILPR